MHIIRLRRPWTRTVVDSDGNEILEAKASVPDLNQAVNSPLVTYSRSFNRPTGLEDSLGVFLTISDWQGQLTSLKLNGNELDSWSKTGPPIRVHVGTQLERSNKLQIQLKKSNQQSPMLCGEVQIEIDD